MKDFFSQFSDYEGCFNQSSEVLGNQYSKENKNYNLYRHQPEILNNENYFGNSKLSGHIIGIDLKKALEGIKEINKINEIIIKIKHGEQVQEATQKTGVEEEGKDENNYFEFQSINMEEYLEFILQAKNKSGDIINIGSRAYSLEGIIIRRQYLVLLDIPGAFKEGEESNNKGEIIFAEIKMNFSLFPSYDKYYELQTRKEETALKIINIKVKQDEEYAKNNQDILGRKMENCKFVKTLNKEELNKKNSLKNDFDHRRIFGFSKTYDYFVEFNNVRYDKMISKGFELEFNNILKVKSNIIIAPSNQEKKIQLNEEQKETAKKNEQNEQSKENEKLELELEKVSEKVEENEDPSKIENELIEQKENMEVRMDEEKYNDLHNSGSQKINIKEHKNLDVKNLNSEYMQKPDINTESMENYSNNEVINESNNKVFVDEKF
jgi:hypothetical protein